MAGNRIIGGGKGPSSVPTPGARPQLALGSRPQTMYAPRIKPLPSSTRDYGKAPAQQPVAGFGNTLGSIPGLPKE